MDINTLRGLSTILMMIAFLGICWWAFSPRRKQRFKEAANLPFDDADLPATGQAPPRQEQDKNQQKLHSSDEARQEQL